MSAFKIVAKNVADYANKNNFGKSYIEEETARWTENLPDEFFVDWQDTTEHSAGNTKSAIKSVPDYGNYGGNMHSIWAKDPQADALDSWKCKLDSDVHNIWTTNKVTAGYNTDDEITEIWANTPPAAIV